MPLLCALGQHDALVQIKTQLQPDAKMFAFLGDIYIACGPDRAKAVHDIMAEALGEKTRIRINCGKTRVWNRASVKLVRVQTMGAGAWVGDHSTPTRTEGMKIMGFPLGHEGFVRDFMAAVPRKHNVLLEKIPLLQGLQCALLLLLFCANSHAIFYSKRSADACLWFRFKT